MLQISTMAKKTIHIRVILDGMDFNSDGDMAFEANGDRLSSNVEAYLILPNGALQYITTYPIQEFYDASRFSNGLSVDMFMLSANTVKEVVAYHEGIFQALTGVLNEDALKIR